MEDTIENLQKEIKDLKEIISELEERCDRLSGAMTDIYLITKDF